MMTPLTSGAIIDLVRMEALSNSCIKRLPLRMAVAEAIHRWGSRQSLIRADDHAIIADPYDVALLRLDRFGDWILPLVLDPPGVGDRVNAIRDGGAVDVLQCRQGSPDQCRHCAMGN